LSLLLNTAEIVMKGILLTAVADCFRGNP
jgi:hypothetical protein